MESLLDVIDDAAATYGDQPSLGLRRDDGSTFHWSFREVRRRSLIVAWRLRALGLRPGDRLLTWSPSTPELPAVFFGAMRAGVVVVPLDLRMSPGAVERIVAQADARRLALGTGRDAPDPGDAGLERFPTSPLDDLTAEPGADFPADWMEQVESWPRPTTDATFEIVYTSGTTGEPKGAILTHGNILASMAAFGRVLSAKGHRIVSLLPLSHIMEQASTLFYGMTGGADVLFVRSRNPRVIFESIRDHRVTTLVVVPQILDLFWSAIEREVERQGRLATFERTRRFARHLPMWLRRRIFRQVHAQFGGGLTIIACAAAFLPPALQQAWEDLGIPVIEGYGTTECGLASATSREDPGLGTVGRTLDPVRVMLAPDGEILVSGPSVFAGYWRDPEATAAVLGADGWYHTGDLGRHDDAGRLILMGRARDIIVLPNGLNVYPEDIENALRVAGIRDSVVLESRPGRIEAVVLAPGSPALPQGGDIPGARADGLIDDSAALRERVDRAIREANATLAAHQRVVGWRLWPDADFPRTHTLKVKRDRVRAWAGVAAPLPVLEDERAATRRR